MCGVSRAVRWEDPDGVEYAEEEALKMATTKEQLAKAGLGGYRLGGYLPANPSGTFTGNDAYTGTSGTSANIFSGFTQGFTQQQQEAYDRQQMEYVRQMAAPQVFVTPEKMGYVPAPDPPSPPSAGRPKESTALAWLDSEIDRMRVRL